MASNRSNRVEVPEAKAAMNRFKTEVASELGVNLKEGYNGDLTSKEAGSIGGEMVRRMPQGILFFRYIPAFPPSAFFIR